MEHEHLFRVRLNSPPQVPGSLPELLQLVLLHPQASPSLYRQRLHHAPVLAFGLNHVLHLVHSILLLDLLSDHDPLQRHINDAGVELYLCRPHECSLGLWHRGRAERHIPLAADKVLWGDDFTGVVFGGAEVGGHRRGMRVVDGRELAAGENGVEGGLGVGERYDMGDAHRTVLGKEGRNCYVCEVLESFYPLSRYPNRDMGG